jgi:crotonobetainyl-CoA:carnitine CoA-transferase CaiB-like acyl-CoA transferase
VPLLDGLTVVEMASVITGPSAGAILADLGARVIKVEPPGGDPFRSWEASGGRIRSSFAAFNRGKESIVLNVKDPQAQDLYVELVRGADVVIENYRPGRMDKLGLGWTRLREVRPSLVYCHITGRGSVGPDAEQPTYDAVAQAVSGLWSQFSDLSAPEPVGPPMADQLTAIYASVAILAAVREAATTGAGQRVEVDMLSAAMAFSAQGVAAATWTGVVATAGSRARNSQSYALIAGDGLPLAVHLSTPHKFWTGLCRVIDRDDLVEDPRFLTKADRIAHYDELRAVLGEAFGSRTREHWLAALVAADVPAAPILDLAEAIASPQVRAKQLVAEDGEGSARGLVRSPIVVDGRHCEAALPPPELGSHTDHVLAALGVDAATVLSLRSSGAVA